MIRLYFVVEGQSEEAFVNGVLRDHLFAQGIHAICCLIDPKNTNKRKNKGGVSKYEYIRSHIIRLMKQDDNPEVRFTTFFDLYQFPADAPGFAESRTANPRERAVRIAEAMIINLRDEYNRLPTYRMLPHIQPYEFEALLFTAPDAIAAAHTHWTEKVEVLRSIRDQYESPEHINDDFPPSKRIKGVLSDYEKVTDGIQAAKNIGLPAIRRHCHHFDSWITRMEQLSANADVPPMPSCD